MEDPRVMSVDEAMKVEQAWNLSAEKKILDAKQDALTLAISLKSGSYSPRDQATGALW